MVAATPGPGQRDPTAREGVGRRVRAFYEEWSFPDYDSKETPQTLAEKARRGVFADMLDRQIPYRARVLDAGCGTGQLPIFLSLAGRATVGADFSLNSPRKGAAFARRFRLRDVHFTQMDLFRPALVLASFEYVICTGVLHHTADPAGAFHGLCSLVRPGGYIIVGLYNRYARLPLHVRRALFLATRGRGRSLDYVLRHQQDPRRREVWFMDQYRNPHETSHTVDDVLGWFAGAGMEYVNSVPPLEVGRNVSGEERLFERRDPGSYADRLAAQLGWMFSIGRESGLFVTIGRRPLP